jgi:uncharacterized PurR-regulated membrane protein YhhQ (DUF165 family)
MQSHNRSQGQDKRTQKISILLTKINLLALISFICYVAVIVLSNILVVALGIIPIGFGLTAPAASLVVGIALLARDIVHKIAGLKWVMIGILFGCIVSWFIAEPSLAIASTAAFGISELLDLGIFSPLQKRGFYRAAFLSNAASAPIDSIVFLTLAGFSLSLSLIGGQVIAKVLWSTVPALIIMFVIDKKGKQLVAFLKKQH